MISGDRSIIHRSGNTLRRRGSTKMGFMPVRTCVPHWIVFVAVLAVVSVPSAHAESFSDLWARITAPSQVTAANQAIATNQAINEQRTRFRIGLDKHVKFQVFSLSQPNRVVVELPDVKLLLPAPVRGKPIGLVKAFRGGSSAPGHARVVIEVTEPVVVEKATVLDAPDGRGKELSLEMVSVAPSAPPQRAASEPAVKRDFPKPTYSLGASMVQPPLPTPAKSLRQVRADSYKPIIVIDPGHGGHDSGAMKNGVVEKNVVLAFGKVLRQKLEATGRYRVLMTRDSDEFIALSKRVDFAEQNRANLFMAIHADYARSSANGATIYSLRDSLARGLSRRTRNNVSSNVLTSQEMAKVKEARGDVSVVRGFLADLAKREVDATRDRTDLFSRSIVNYMGKSTTMRSKPHKSAGFRVLKTQKFPSVLIELAYVTNKDDAAKLKSDAWRSTVADSLTKAVDDYFTLQIAAFPM